MLLAQCLIYSPHLSREIGAPSRQTRENQNRVLTAIGERYAPLCRISYIMQVTRLYRSLILVYRLIATLSPPLGAGTKSWQTRVKKNLEFAFFIQQRLVFIGSVSKNPSSRVLKIISYSFNMHFQNVSICLGGCIHWLGLDPRFGQATRVGYLVLGYQAELGYSTWIGYRFEKIASFLVFNSFNCSFQGNNGESRETQTLFSS